MKKILIALVLGVVMNSNVFSFDDPFRDFYDDDESRDTPPSFSENYISTSLNEQMYVQCLKDASPNISQEAMNRCWYEKRSRSHMGVWKKKNPWFNRHFGDIWDWNKFMSMRNSSNSNKSHRFNIILNEMRADGYFLNSSGTYDNEIAFKKLDAKLGDKPIITLLRKYKDSTLTEVEKGENLIKNHRQTCLNIGFNDETEGMAECIKDLYLRSIDSQKNSTFNKEKLELEQENRIEQERALNEKKRNEALAKIFKEDLEAAECDRKAKTEAIIIRPGQLGGFGAYEDRYNRIYQSCINNN